MLSFAKKNSMRHTVSGATGLVGSHLVMELLKQGKQVRALHRASSDKSLLNRVFAYYNLSLADFDANLEWMEADLLDPYGVDAAVEGTDIFFHCAALVSFDPKDRKALIEDNRKMTAFLVNVALEKGIRRFVHVSSVAALGRKPGQTQFSEDSHWVESDHNSNYAKGKYAAELEVWRAIEEGLSAAMVNPCIILGPGTWEDGSAAIFRNVAEGFKFYSKGIHAFVDVRDVVKVMLLLAEQQEIQDRFLIAAENWSYEQVFNTIADKMNKPRPSIEIKPWMSALAWRWEAFKSALTGKRPMVTRETARTAIQEYHYQNAKSIEVLGMEYRDLKESIEFIADLYQREQKA